jgi:predicted patatin/cPLA2 family phospholipase
MTTHAVESLIRKRVAEQSKPLRRTDPYKLALVVEGGGMRGVVSAGMAAALESLGLRDAFDVVFGSSAGAMNAAYFLAGQARFGTTIYYEDLTGTKFIDFKRLFSGKPIADLDGLSYEIQQHRKALNWEAIKESRIQLNVLVTTVDGDLAILNQFHSQLSLLAALRASAAMPAPWVGGGPVVVGSIKGIDAGVAEGIPLQPAKEADSTHILILRTRARGRVPRVGFLDRYLVAPRVARYSDGHADQLKRRYLTRYDRYLSDVDEIDRAERDDEHARPHMHSIMPVNPAGQISQGETRRERLVAAATEGARQALSAFGVKHVVCTEQLAFNLPSGEPLPTLGSSSFNAYPVE